MACSRLVHDEEGKVNTVRYEAVNAMLEEQADEIAQTKKQIDALAATVQNGREQIEMNEPARHLLINSYKPILETIRRRTNWSWRRRRAKMMMSPFPCAFLVEVL